MDILVSILWVVIFLAVFMGVLAVIIALALTGIIFWFGVILTLTGRYRYETTVNGYKMIVVKYEKEE